jgi:hypothetical protein
MAKAAAALVVFTVVMAVLTVGLLVEGALTLYV